MAARLVVVEHKSSSEDLCLGSTFSKRLKMASQPSLYIPAAISLGYDVIGCLYDALRKPEQQPYKATPIEARKYTQPTKKDPTPRLYANQRERDETPEEYGARVLEAIKEAPDKYYQRFIVNRLEFDRDEAAKDIWQTSQTIRDARRLNVYPRNPASCVQWSRTCDYFAVCCGEASIDDPMLFEQSKRKHLELDEVKREHEWYDRNFTKVCKGCGRTVDDMALTEQCGPAPLELLTDSSLSTFRSCPRKYKYRYELRVRPLTLKAEPLRLGTSVHRALEGFWRTGDFDAAIGKLDIADPYSNAKEKAMMIGYYARWGRPTGVIAVEKEWAMDLLNPETGAKSRTFRLGGKIDCIAEEQGA